jgi:hypothetical protein
MRGIAGLLAKVLVVATIAAKVLPAVIELIEKLGEPTETPPTDKKDAQ